MPAVSIIVPCYNEQATIRYLLEAVNSQTFTRSEMEVVVADGLSNDGTIGEIEAFQHDHPDLTVRVVVNQNRSIPAALNTAVRASKGKFIIRLDAHSIPAPDYVARCLDAVIDDATLAGKRGSFRFDDEGTPAQRTILVENGILKSYMYDKLTAMKEGKKSTGNGRRESYQNRPIPRMTNTFIAPGTHDPNEIVASVDHGLLVVKMGGGQVNTVTGDFVFDVQEGYLIRNGQIGDLVRGATLTGNGPQVLKSIDMVGADLGFSIGTCG